MVKLAAARLLAVSPKHEDCRPCARPAPLPERHLTEGRRCAARRLPRSNFEARCTIVSKAQVMAPLRPATLVWRRRQVSLAVRPTLRRALSHLLRKAPRARPGPIWNGALLFFPYTDPRAQPRKFRPRRRAWQLKARSPSSTATICSALDDIAYVPPKESSRNQAVTVRVDPARSLRAGDPCWITGQSSIWRMGHDPFPTQPYETLAAIARLGSINRHEFWR